MIYLQLTKFKFHSSWEFALGSENKQNNLKFGLLRQRSVYRFGILATLCCIWWRKIRFRLARTQFPLLLRPYNSKFPQQDFEISFKLFRSHPEKILIAITTLVFILISNAYGKNNVNCMILTRYIVAINTLADVKAPHYKILTRVSNLHINTEYVY